MTGAAPELPDPAGGTGDDPTAGTGPAGGAGARPVAAAGGSAGGGSGAPPTLTAAGGASAVAGGTGAVDVVVLGSADLLAAAAAARLITAVVDAQAARGTASVVLTGGGVGGKVLRAVRDSPARDAVDWSRVDVWWGDERWLPAGDPERNDRQARDALLSAVPVDPARVHAFPAADGEFAGDPDAAAAAYAADLAAALQATGPVSAGGPAAGGPAADGPATGGSAAGGPVPSGPVPAFDVLMLGVGEEGHVASIFPDSPAARSGDPVVAVRDCPKPPPTRLSLTFPSIAAATEVWLMTAGAGKAGAVARALAGASPLDVPAAGARGRTRTLWLLDTEAARTLTTPVDNLDAG